MEQYVKEANKGHKQVIFEPRDWVWVHMRKERFLAHRQVNKHASRDPLHIREGSITRARAKKMQEALNGLIEDVRVKSYASPTLEEQQYLFHFMHVQA